MPTINNQTNRVDCKRIVKAPPDKAYRAWTEPAQMTKWMGCNMVKDVRVDQDFRVGGNYRVYMTRPDGVELEVWGTFQEIAPNEKLSYTWNSDFDETPTRDTLVTVEFKTVANGTEIHLKHERFETKAESDNHSIGWTNSLEGLANLLDSNNF